MYQTLDVGSGSAPIGDINIDYRFWYYGSDTVLDICAVGEWLPFRNASFRCVCARHLLEHVHNPYTLLKEMVRVSAKYVFISGPNPRNWRVWLFDVLSDDHLVEGYTERSLRKLCKMAGLAVRKVSYTNRDQRRMDIILDKINMVRRFNCREIQILAEKEK